MTKVTQHACSLHTDTGLGTSISPVISLSQYIFITSGCPKTHLKGKEENLS